MIEITTLKEFNRSRIDYEFDKFRALFDATLSGLEKLLMAFTQGSSTGLATLG
jgi:hypothetical protein